jgi:small subunit ribosomal protein S8
MNLNDPISDLLTRIRNAGTARHATVSMPHSKLKQQLAEILKREGYIHDVTVEEGEGVRRNLLLTLKYDGRKAFAIRGLRRVSKPGLRRYVGAQEAPRVLNGLGISILSTSKGILTDREARKNGAGGEILCQIW